MGERGMSARVTRAAEGAEPSTQGSACRVAHLVTETHHALDPPHGRGQRAPDLVALRPPRQRDKPSRTMTVNACGLSRN